MRYQCLRYLECIGIVTCLALLIIQFNVNLSFRMNMEDARQELEEEKQQHEQYARMMMNFDPGDYLIDDDDDDDNSLDAYVARR